MTVAAGMAGRRMERIDLIALGTDGPPAWDRGAALACAARPDAVADAIARHLAADPGEHVLFWDPALGRPDPALVARLAGSRVDVFHAGLSLGAAGRPRVLDFVAPAWMLNRDPPPEREATSWRLSLRAALIRTQVLGALGGVDPGFRTLEGAALELGHRFIQRGALMRHTPSLVGAAPGEPPAPLPLEDELRFLRRRHGELWLRWAATRAVLSGYASPLEMWPTLVRVAAEGPRPNPPPLPRVAPEPPASAPIGPARVSVLIPTLDRYPYLRQLLDQLRRQTVRPLEILVVDQTEPERRDGALATDFADLPLVLMYRDAPGQCTSRNAALAVARGDHILFLDDDVEVGPDLIERHLRNLAWFDAEVSSGVAEEVGGPPLSSERFVGASSVFPTGNSMIRTSVLRRSGLFDLAYDRAQRADGDLGMRLYLSGALMVLDSGISVLHHRAPRGGLRVHRARVATYGTSRRSLSQRHLPSVSDIYLTRRYFSEAQVREFLWLKVFSTLSAHGGASRRAAKALVASVLLPDTIHAVSRRYRESSDWLARFPDIPALPEPRSP